MMYALDIETEFIRDSDPANKGLQLYGLCLYNDNAEYVIRYTGDIEQKQWLQSMFSSHRMIVHNSTFDVAVLQHHGFNVPLYEDTMVMSYILNPGGKHSLKHWGERLGSPKLPFLDFSSGWSEEMAKYCLQDTKLTWKLYQHLRSLLEVDQRAYECYLKVDLPYTKLIMSFENTGFSLDSPLLRSLRAKYKARIIELEEEMTALAMTVPGKTKEYKRGYLRRGDKVTYNHCEIVPFNPRSNKHIGFALQKCGWKPTEFTATREVKVGSNVLKGIKEFRLSSLLLEHRNSSKLLSTYIEPLEERVASSEDGKVRANFNHTFTITGRLSSSQPNLQNIPIGSDLRSVFVAPAGYLLVGVDLGQIEARVLAHYLARVFQDYSLIEILTSGEDFHQANADKMGVTRYEAKTLLYSVMYGIGPTKLGNGDAKKGKDLLYKQEKAFPNIKRLIRTVHQTARKRNGVVYSAFGRRLSYPDISNSDGALRSRAERQVFNALIQGTAADLFKLLQLEAFPRLMKVAARPIAAIHDELICEVLEDRAEGVAQTLTNLFTTDKYLLCPIEGVAKVGKSWYDVK